MSTRQNPRCTVIEMAFGRSATDAEFANNLTQFESQPHVRGCGKCQATLELYRTRTVIDPSRKEELKRKLKRKLRL